MQQQIPRYGEQYIALEPVVKMQVFIERKFELPVKLIIIFVKKVLYYKHVQRHGARFG